MRILNFIIFFSVVLLVYGSVNYYVYIRGLQALPPGARLRTIYTVLFLLLVLSFLAGRILEGFYMSFFSDALIWIGSFWLAVMVYFFLTVLVIDLVRLVDHFFPFLHKVYVPSPSGRPKLLTIIVVLVLTVVAAGHWNAARPRIKHLQIDIQRPSRLDSLRIVTASDIHLGTVVGRERLDKYVDIINDLKPDLILLPGDIVDEDLAPVIRQNLGDALTKLNSKYGVYAVTGNHEYIGGATQACRYLEDHGVDVLRDSVTQIDSAFYLVGREDLSKNRFTKEKRKTLAQLMEKVNPPLPTILLDHQPFNLDQSAQLGVDLQLSGHTHNGQLWPFNYITGAVYEVSHGYKRKHNTHIYVSCGLGTWGPPVRTSSRPEIVIITLNFDNQKKEEGHNSQ